jgi:hypothetical protein
MTVDKVFFNVDGLRIDRTGAIAFLSRPSFSLMPLFLLGALL